MASNEYVLGQVIQLKDLITNPNSTPTADAPIDDPTDVVTVYKPDGTTVSPTPAVTHGALNSGQYTAVIIPDQAGWWEYLWLSTTTGAGAGRGRFFVSPVP